MKGRVILAGAGPGDPEMATVGLMRHLSQADVVVYDYLANPELLKAAPRAKFICVGKRAGGHSWVQPDINRLIVRLAKSGKRVLRLKGGDPFVFGRGGEEALELKHAGVPFEVVPGVTSGIAALSYAGIPLTHRGMATAAVFVTGQEQSGKPLRETTLERLAKLEATIVFYMATAQAARICSSLIRHGRKASTPAALVHQGTYPSQRVLTGTLASLPTRMAAEGLGAPGLIVIGEVAGLRSSLKWFENKALFGKRVIVTRAREQASKLAQGLKERGASVLETPTIRIQPLRLNPQMKLRLKALNKARWLIVTSTNGAECLMARLQEAGLDARHLAGVRLAAIGSSTAEVLKSKGLVPDLVPLSFVAEDLAQALLKAEGSKLRGARVVLARAAEGRDVLPLVLGRAGAKVSELKLYKTVADTGSKAALRAAVMNGEADWVTFTSSLTVKLLMDQLDPKARATARRKIVALCMGPVTKAAAVQAGFAVGLTSPKATIPDFLRAIEAYAAAKS